MKMLLDNSKTEDGNLVVPTSYGAEGWAAYGEFSIRGGAPHLTHLYQASMSEADHELVTHVRDGSAEDLE